MNSPHHPHHHHHHDVHQQRLLWFFSFCNQRSSSSSNSSSSSTHSHGGSTKRALGSRRAKASSRNKFALQYQQQLQRQQRQSSNVFGKELIEHTRSFGDHLDSIPFIVKSCTKFIEKHGIIFGIYRLSGMRVNIHKLRQDFDKNPKIITIDNESITNDAHAVACVLKQYFRELPTPLLTFHMYERFIELFKRGSCDVLDENEAEDDDHIISTTTHTPTRAIVTNDNANSDNPKAIPEKTPIPNISHRQSCGPIDQVNSSADDDTIQNIDDEDDNDINCGDSARTISDKSSITKPITRQPPAVSATMSTSVFKPDFGKQANVQITPITTSSGNSSIHKQSTVTSESSRGSTGVDYKSNYRYRKFTTSASDSQLITLSSVVTTTTADVKYRVKLGDLKKLLLQLPKAHYQTLKYLMRHLAFIAANGQKTGMDSKNVAIVWAPNLLKPRELELSAGHIETLQVIGLQAVITEQLIKHHRFLFDDDSDTIDEAIREDDASPRVSSSDCQGEISAETKPQTDLSHN